MFPRLRPFSLAFAMAFLPSVCLSQLSAPAIVPNGTGRPANTEATYATLRGVLPMGPGVSVKDLTLKRQGGEFHFDDGTFFFYGPVNGWVTGAVFEGKGHFVLTPPDVNEQHSLALLTKSTTMSQDFTTVVLRFTDGTAEEIKKAASGPSSADAGEAAKAAAELAKSFRQTIHQNLEERLLEDVLSSRPGDGQSGFFLASFRAGGFFAGKNLLFMVDPEGAPAADGDEVELATWDSDNGFQPWVAYRRQADGDGGVVAPMRVTDEDIDVGMDKSGKLTGEATVSFVANRPGLRLAQFDLFPTLRVSAVYSEMGLPLDFIQEDKKYDPEFAVELPQGAKPGQPTRLLIEYSGPDAVQHEGEGVYELVHAARTSWYPAGNGFHDFANYRLTFHVPKGLEVVATGDQVAHDRDGGTERFVWATRTPLPIVGFNIGEFKQEEVKTPQGFAVDGFADENLPDWAVNSANQGFGSLATPPGLKNQVALGNAAIQIYSNYFGALPWNHVSLTQQNTCLDGQGYPTMVYLPICAFWDATEQHTFGLRDFDMPEFWKVVTPHEVAHQWWGDLIGWSTYRDQWMSEGFADFSAGLFLLNTSQKMDDYHEFWSDEHKMLFQKNANGKRPIDVGPVTMGYRVDNVKSGDDVARAVIYAKGAYILHMLEMMYWTSQYQEEPFKHSMQEFVKEYSGKAASTEDFKHSLEKTMPKWLDLEGNGKLDWFFNEYVYGTAVPHYDVTSDFTANPDGTTTAHFKVTQSGVTNDFLMLVPLYMQLDNGATFRLGNLQMRGDVSLEHTVKLNKMPSAPKKLLVNYNADVLSD